MPYGEGPVRFTFRERTILKLFAGGRSPADIAAKLEANVATVNLHLRSVVSKAGLECRSQIRTYLNQNSKVTRKGGHGARGLHEPNPACGCYSCRMLTEAA